MLNDDAPLAQGTYIICGADRNTSCTNKELIMSPSPQNSLVITAETVFRWDVLHPLMYKKSNEFTIEEYDEDHKYAVPEQQDRKVHIARESQVYDISYVREGIYRIFIHNTDMALKWVGSGQPVQVLATDPSKDSDDISLEWLFCKASDPFVAYGTFFWQDTSPNPHETKVFPHFGLLPLNSTSDKRWQIFWGEIDELNNTPETKGKIFYKVIFLGRHGQAVNNIASEQDAAGDLTLGPDPELTQEGFLDATNVHTFWVKEQAEANIGLPQISYCSPFTRCMITNTISFGVEVYGTNPPKLSTLIVENCREKCSDKDTKTEQRRDKYYITHMFPKFSADGLVDKIVNGRAVDPMYPEEETMKEVRARARAVLKTIFVDDNEDKKFVSITTHSGFIEAFLRVVGRGPYAVPNGTVIPLVIQYTKD